MGQVSTSSKCGWWGAVLLGCAVCVGVLEGLRGPLNQSLLWYMVAPGVWSILFVFVGMVLSRKLLRSDGSEARYGPGFLVAGVLVLIVACFTIWRIAGPGSTGAGP
jgi:hypothetical protein